MLSHVISIPFIALRSTHTALQLPQSPLLPCRRNISFPANSYPLQRRKFHFVFQYPSGILPPENFSTPPPPPLLGAALKEYTSCTPRERNIKKRYIIILYPFYYQTHARMYACMYVSTFFKEGNAKQ